MTPPDADGAPRQVFVTGATGFIGHRVVRRLLAEGDLVRCLVRASSDTHRIADLPVELVRGDLGDADLLGRAVQGCTSCVHLASVSAWREIGGPDVEDVVVGGTAGVVAAARAAGARLVYVSSVAAVSGSRHPEVFDESAAFRLEDSGLRYAVAKHRAEELVLAGVREGLDAVIVNPAETYGPDDVEDVTSGVIRDVLRSWPVLAVSGGTSVVHVDDVADGIVRALRYGRPGRRYILGGENLTVEQLMRTVLAVAGRRAPVLVVPRVALRALVTRCLLLRVRPPLDPDLVGYATRYWFVDSTRAREELGFQPRDARTTLASVVAWIRGEIQDGHGPA